MLYLLTTNISFLQSFKPNNTFFYQHFTFPGFVIGVLYVYLLLQPSPEPPNYAVDKMPNKPPNL